ncbi:MAG TPA: hypothetical protein VFP80_03585 [Thermoanaerobaculia bacterium]|nr:hypothetical protein [Thermoanaerobaculia bacterium]
MKRLLFVALSILLAATAEADRRRASRSPGGWTVPQCTAVTGFPAVALSLDGGASVLPQSEGVEGLQIHTFGLAATDKPNRLLAITGRVLLVSEDGGCSWSPEGRLGFPEHLYRFAGSWAWSPLAPALFRAGDAIEQRTAPVLLPLTLGVEPAYPQRLATADDQGAIWWSEDGAQTWALHATAPARPPLYALEFSARGRAHALAAGLADGAHVTFDGGATWTPSAGLAGLNVFRIAFSPIDPDVVWAVAIDPKGKGPSRRGIFLSNDGGRSFRRVLAGSAEVQMTNGFTLAPSPVDRSLLHFALAGTSLVLLDDTGTIRRRAELPHRDVNAIVFSPASPHVMVLGLKISDMSAQ